MSTKTDESINEPSKLIKTSRKKRKDLDLYYSTVFSKTCYIPIINVGNNIKQTLEKYVITEIEGKCISEGYIKPNSVKLITYSNGIVNGSNIIFEVVINCKVCSPVEGMYINCIAKNITKAGIKAEVNENPTPVIIFIARDHNYMSKNFSAIQENQEIKIKVIGQRYELNDKYISIIGELIGDLSLSKAKTIKTPPQSLKLSMEDIPPISLDTSILQQSSKIPCIGAKCVAAQSIPPASPAPELSASPVPELSASPVPELSASPAPELSASPAPASPAPASPAPASPASALPASATPVLSAVASVASALPASVSAASALPASVSAASVLPASASALPASASAASASPAPALPASALPASAAPVTSTSKSKSKKPKLKIVST